MSIKEDTRKDEESVSATKLEKISPVSTIHKKEHKKKHYHRNLKQIFSLFFDALRERKARSILTILMVVAGGGLMIALDGMSAGVASLINKQLVSCHPMYCLSLSQINFRGGPSPPPTIIFNSEVVSRIKSLPYVQDVLPSYQGQFELNAQGNILTTPVLSIDPSKLRLISPSLELVPGSSIQENNPSSMIVGDTIANPPGKTGFVMVGQNIKATYSFADPRTGKLEQQSRSFVTSAIMEPSGNIT